MDALRSQTDGIPWAGPTIDAAVLTALAQACRDDEPVAFAYTARDGSDTRRRVEPHRLVSVGRRWYLVAYDRDRQDWRSFRVDRVAAVEPSGQRFRPRQLPATDAPAFVEAGIRSMAHRYDVRLRIALPADVVEADLGRWATVTPDGDGCRVRMPTDTLDWPLMVLARLDAAFEVEGPEELRVVLASVSSRFAQAAGATAAGAS
jgi:predicted DNA-binding transcriptional regulator YafY